MSADEQNYTHDSTREGHPYVRVTVRMDPNTGARRTVWAVKLPRKPGVRFQGYTVIDNEGSPVRETKDADIREVILASDGDVLREQPALLNFRYGEMELAPKSKKPGKT